MMRRLILCLIAVFSLGLIPTFANEDSMIQTIDNWLTDCSYMVSINIEMEFASMDDAVDDWYAVVIFDGNGQLVSGDFHQHDGLSESVGVGRTFHAPTARPFMVQVYDIAEPTEWDEADLVNGLLLDEATFDPSSFHMACAGLPLGLVDKEDDNPVLTLLKQFED